MKNNTKIIVGITSAAAVGLIIYFCVNKKNRQKREEKLEAIADAGYETAQDVLYPLRNMPLRKYRLQ